MFNDSPRPTSELTNILEGRVLRLRKRTSSVVSAIDGLGHVTASEHRELKSIAALFRELATCGMNPIEAMAAGEKLVARGEALLAQIAARRVAAGRSRS